jgi:hypothetical protein
MLNMILGIFTNIIRISIFIFIKGPKNKVTPLRSIIRKNTSLYICANMVLVNTWAVVIVLRCAVHYLKEYFTLCLG